jgi:antitoxin FitA
MASITVTIPEDLVLANIEGWLATSNDEFTQSTSYVLKKNAELYRRLA